MLDEMLGRLNTSANIVGTMYAFSLKKSRAICISKSKQQQKYRQQVLKLQKIASQREEEWLKYKAIQGKYLCNGCISGSQVLFSIISL